MKVRLFRLLALCCAFGLIVSFPGSDSSRSQTQKTMTGTSVSPAEQELLNEINLARANPAKYAAYLEGLKPFFKGKEYQPTGHQALITQEGWAAVEEAIRFMHAAKPVAPLDLSSGLNIAAQAHVKDQGGSGGTGHKGTNMSLVEERVKPYGSWQGAIGENLSYGNESARERVLTWLIDDGVASRGHRKRLLSSDYRVGGLACGAHREWGTMCCLTLAGAFTDLKPANTSTAASKSTTSSTNANTRTPATKSAATNKTANTSTQTNKSKPTSGKAPE